MAAIARAQALPYNPSNILLFPSSDIAYILHATPNLAQLLSFSYKHGFDTPSKSFTTVSKTLPFLQSDQGIAFTSTIGSDGSITVLAGD